MKKTVALVIVLGLGALSYYWLTTYLPGRDHGHLIAYAVGSPGGGILEINVVIPFIMTRHDPPKLKPNGQFQTWNEWLEEHFELRDDTGKRVMLHNSDWANVIPKGKMVGTPKFYAVGPVEPDTEYTFVFYPEGSGQPKRYRHTFALSQEGKKFERAQFMPVG